ncbi:MAG TPA: hypothetical protein VGK19_07950 [Capsulimonadaceae bacterium]|jgi:hypothetical protein
MTVALRLTVLLAVFGALHSPAANADMTVAQKLTFDLSKLTIMGQPVTAEQMAMIQKLPLFGGGSMDITMYSAGKKFKVESPVAASIVDMDAKTNTMIFPSKKSYTVSSLQTDALKQLDSSTVTTVTPLNQTQTILGHLSRLVKFSIKNTMMTINGNAWLADDLATLPQMAGANPTFDLIRSKLVGMPVKLNVTISCPMLFDQANLGYEVNSISTAPVSPNVFTIPDGYTKVAPSSMTDLHGLW